MLNATLIVFRETLEAALIIGIISAATQGVPRRSAWIGLGVALGLAGAGVVASLAEQLGQLAGGMGHDFFNALVLATAIGMLAWHSIWMSSHGRQFAAQARELGASVVRGDLAMRAVTLAIALTVLREGAETVLFFFGILAGGQANARGLAAGALAGLAAGAGAGVLIYRGLLWVPVRHVFLVTTWLVLFVTAGLAAQLAQVLIQADLVSPIVQPLWDTSGWIPRDSGIGILMHALVGYDPQPSATQILFAVTVLVTVALAARRAARSITHGNRQAGS
jgi:high-affinity iron transporter